MMKAILCIALLMCLTQSYFLKQEQCCETGNYYDTAGKKCAKCSDKCNGCDESSENHDNGIDTGCVCKGSLCEKGQCNKDGCNKCIVDAKKTIFKAAGECFECTDKENCLECTAGKDKCNKCKAKTALVGDACQACSANCATCNSSAVCTACDTMHYLSGKICTGCNVTGCKTCSKVDECTTCASNKGLISKKCEACDSTYATSCNTAKDKADGCMTVSDRGAIYNSDAKSCTECLANCKSCTDAAKCKAGNCKAGYSAATNEGSCVVCKVGVATTDTTGLHWKTDGTDTGCKTCKDGDDGPTKCTTCADKDSVLNLKISYVAADNACHPGCKELDADGIKCKTCAPMTNLITAKQSVWLYRYHMTNGSCLVCTPGCMECQTKAADKCTKAGWGMILAGAAPNSVGKCTGANDKYIGCTTCSAAEDVDVAKKCNACLEGFKETAGDGDLKTCTNCTAVTDSNSYCKACVTSDGNSHANAKCSSCKTGYFSTKKTFADAGSACEACKSGCAKCKHDGGDADSKSTCEECDATTKGVKTADQTCEACTVGSCTACAKDSAKCTKCADGKYLKSETECAACADGKNCATCTDDKACATCTTGNVKGADGFCAACATGCKSGECTVPGACNTGKCADNNFEATAITCKACSNNCKTCTDDKTCTACNTGYVLKDKVCEACHAQCTDCTTNGKDKCDSGKCKDSWYFKDNSCTACADTSCKTCTADGCTECLKTSKKGIKEKKCVDCVENCDECMTDQAKCAKCKVGYWGDGTAACTKCESTCTECTAKATCTKCQAGHSGATCHKCAANCTLCATKDKCDKDKCAATFVYMEATQTCAAKVTCTATQYDDKNVCKDCGANCMKCAGTDSCTTCKDGYGQDGSTNKCKACAAATGLKNCDKDGKALTCLEGFGLQGGTCKGCIDKCADCADATTCTTCLGGYGATQDKKKCEACAEGCKMCHSQCERSCTMCFDKKKTAPNCKCDAGTTWNATKNVCEKAAANAGAATAVQAPAAAASANVLKFAMIVLISLIALL